MTGDLKAALSEVEKGKGLGATPQGRLIREVLITDDNGGLLLDPLPQPSIPLLAMINLRNPVPLALR